MYTKLDILNDLDSLEIPVGVPITVHSSLRSVGEIEGGGETLLDALIEFCERRDSLLIIPAHTWHNLGIDRITLDMTMPESCLGALSHLALNDKRGIRSENPTHSVVVFGNRERALELISEESLVATPTAKESALGKLYRDNGYILLIGVSQTKNTFLHATDEILGIFDRMSEKSTEVSVKRLDGTVVSRKITMYDEEEYGDVSQRFGKFETAFRYDGCLIDGFIGDAPTQLCSARGVLETVKKIYSRSGIYDPLSDERPIPPKLYIRK